MPWSAAVLLAVALAAGCRADARQCEQACRNVSGLLAHELAEREILAAPAAERDALRQRKQGEIAGKIEQGLAMCVSQCRSAGDQTAISCMIAATTAQQARACSK